MVIIFFGVSTGVALFFLHLGIVRVTGTDEVVVDEIIEGFLRHECRPAGQAFIDFNLSLITVFANGLFGDTQTNRNIIERNYTLPFI